MRKTAAQLLIGIFFILIPFNIFSQSALLTVSGGTGFGFLSENFEDNGEDAALQYAAPAALLAGELGWGDFYMEMSLSVLFLPVIASLGGEEVDLTDYTLNMGLDFTAIGLGYEYALKENLKVGGSVGFHVSSISLSPPNSDYTKLALEGYYGLIGLNITPRIRYAVSDSIVTTLSIPIGFDFSPMSEDIVVADSSGNLINTGLESSAIVTPEGLTALYKGFTMGLYVSIGFQQLMPF